MKPFRAPNLFFHSDCSTNHVIDVVLRLTASTSSCSLTRRNPLPPPSPPPLFSPEELITFIINASEILRQTCHRKYVAAQFEPLPGAASLQHIYHWRLSASSSSPNIPSPTSDSGTGPQNALAGKPAPLPTPHHDRGLNHRRQAQEER